MMACSCICVNFADANGKRTILNSVVTDEHIKENIKIIEIHRIFVYAFGKAIYPQYDFIAHDLSKFSSAELIPYTLKFILKVSDSENPGWNAALQHHYQNNPHHPQMWKGDMPEEYLHESIVDMIAAKYQYREGGQETLPGHLTADMFDLQPMYLTRYTDTDRRKVLNELKRLRQIDWTTKPLGQYAFKCQG